MISPADEQAREADGPAFADAVTFAFGDPVRQLYGIARLGLSAGGSGSALAILFSGRDPVAAVARGGIELDGGGFERLAVDGLSATIEQPLAQWNVGFDSGGQGFSLEFQALGPPAEMEPGEPVVELGGMTGYEQLCAVTGTVTAGGRSQTIECLGQRGHSWGAPDWTRIESARTIAAWPSQGAALAYTAVRPEGAHDHAAEASWAALLDAGGARRIADPRLSTTYDPEGRQRRAGLELWLDDDEGYPERASGRVLCGSSLDLGQLRLDCAFFGWNLDGRPAVGRYDILRRA